MSAERTLPRWLDDRWPRWMIEGDPRDGQRVPFSDFAHSAAVRVIYRCFDVEWDESWRAWPHCCTQRGCWMHITSSTPWCRCACRWCRIAEVAQIAAELARRDAAAMSAEEAQA